MKQTKFASGEFYHIYNRGVDKRIIFLDHYDVRRFLQSIEEFNCVEPIGSIYELSFLKTNSELGRRTSKSKRLVNIIVFCLNPNHIHLILEQIVEGGVSEFMKRLGGYTKYFNNKYKRNGVLFQGRFKARHIKSNDYLLHLSAYVNLNNKVHKIDKLGRRTSKLSVSSWNEYVGVNKNNICKKDSVLGQFKNKQEYKKFAENSLVDIIERKNAKRDLENLKDLLLE